MPGCKRPLCWGWRMRRIRWVSRCSFRVNGRLQVVQLRDHAQRCEKIPERWIHEAPPGLNDQGGRREVIVSDIYIVCYGLHSPCTRITSCNPEAA